MIRVLLVDDQQLIRAGLRMLCESSDDIAIVGEAANGHEAVRQAMDAVPDVVVMDLRMPGMDGITATKKILDGKPSLRVLVLTTFDDDDHLYPALAAGACGFLAKDAAPADLLDGIHRAADGENPFSRHALHSLVAHAVRSRDSRTPAKPEPPLTTREREVLAGVAGGLSNAEIGQRLHLGITTVKTHVSNLMTKTGTDNRVRLAMFAVEHGLASGGNGGGG